MAIELRIDDPDRRDLLALHASRAGEPDDGGGSGDDEGTTHDGPVDGAGVGGEQRSGNQLSVARINVGPPDRSTRLRPR